MATKTKARKSIVAATAELQEAIRQVGIAQSRLAAYLIPPEGPTSCLLQAKTALSQAASHLLRLLKAQERGRSPHRRKGAKPAKRSNVAGALQTLSQLRASKRRVESRKGFSRKQAGKEFFHGQDIPH